MPPGSRPPRPPLALTKEAWLLRDHLNRSAKNRRGPPEPSNRPALLSLRTTVILALAAAGGLMTAHWSAPEFGFGAWLTLIIGLDNIIDRGA
jgi:hypothetical protein